MARKAAKKSAKRSRAKGTAGRKRTTRPGQVQVTRSRVIFTLTPKEISRAKQCLDESGEIRIGFKEIRVTKLPSVLDDGKLID